MSKNRVLDFIRMNTAMSLLGIVMFMLSLKIWFMDFPITTTQFSEVILGMAAAKNIDVRKLIAFYALYAVPLSLLFAYLFHRDGYYERLVNRLKKWPCKWDKDNILGAVIILGQLLLGNRNWVSWTYILALLIAWFYLRHYNPAADKIKVLSLWVKIILIFSIPCIFIGQWLGGVIPFIVFAVLSILHLCRVVTDEKCIDDMECVLQPLMLAAIVAAVMLAVMEVVLLRGNGVNAIILLLPYVLAGGYAWATKANTHFIHRDFNFYGCLALMVFTFLPVLGSTGDIDFFEGANHGLSIEEAILGMGIPILHNLDAHLLANTLPGILYYHLTGDYVGAIFSPYANICTEILVIASLAYLLRRFFGSNETLLLLALFPVYKIGGYFLGFIIFATFVYWKEKQGIWQNLVLFIVFTLMSFYRIDQGASFGAALICCPLIYCLLQKKYIALGKYLITGLMWGGVIILLAGGVANAYGEDLFTVIQSFLTAFSSNQHWAVGMLGNFLRAYWFYFLVPIIFAVAIIPYIQRVAGNIERKNDCLVIFLYLAFLFNIPRATVRHTLAEPTAAPYAVVLVLLALLAMNIWEKRQELIFVVVLFAGSVILVHGGGNMVIAANVANTAEVIESVQRQEHAYYRINENDARQIEAYKAFFAANLAEDETYFDFSNQSLFFAFTERPNPIYINQCPGMINGNKGQKQALASLRKTKPKFVVMPYRDRSDEPSAKHARRREVLAYARPMVEKYVQPVQLREKMLKKMDAYDEKWSHVKSMGYSASVILDDLLEFDRYYLLTDYVTENYRPYCSVGNFAVWCLKDEYAARCEQDKNQKIDREYLDYTYEPLTHHIHPLGHIPYIWGNCEIKNIDSELLIVSQYNGQFALDDKSILGRRGFITLEIEAPSSDVVEVCLQGDNVHDVKYQFAVRQGTHRYRLQVSSDILWYSGRLSQLRLIDGDAQIKHAYFEKITGEL